MLDIREFISLLNSQITFSSASVIICSLLVGFWFTFHSKSVKRVGPIPFPHVEDQKTGEEATDVRVISSDGKLIYSFDPSTLQPLSCIEATPIESLPEIIQNAHNAQQLWKSTSFEQRSELLRTLKSFILSNQLTICKVSSQNTGKTFVDGFFGEILTTLEKIEWTLNNGKSVLATEFRSTGFLTMHKSARVEYHPRGVVVAVVSWNYPFHNVFGPIISALFAGNAIIIKPSEFVAWSTFHYYSKIIEAALEACNVPTNLVKFVYGGPQLGEALVSSRGINKVTFIGSPRVGKLVMKAAAENLTPVTLELGGKDAAIICDDVDLDSVVPIILRGTFQNMGQNCVGLERVVIQESILDEFLEKVKPLVEDLHVGPPIEEFVDCGAMTTPVQLKHVQEMVDSAVKEGAKLLVGGFIHKHEDFNGMFFAPTILTNVTSDMKISQTEVFGPVMTIMKFTDDEDAIKIVNSSPFGLGGSVFSANIARAERIVSCLEVGMCNINDFGVNYLCQSLPFGGVKESGFGRFAGVEGLRAECVLKSITRDKISFIKTSIPPPLQYPIQPGSVRFCRGLSQLAYGETLRQRVNGVFDLLRALIN